MEGGFDVATVHQAIARTRFADSLRHFSSVTSTNTLAVEAAQQGAAAAVLVADEQTAGRGRGGHQWLSVPGDGLYVSILVRPRMPIAQALWLSLAAGLAAQVAILEASGLKVEIRWPNDLILSGRKCGGILVETSAETVSSGDRVRLRYAVIGIGININNASFPEDLRPVATSLLLEGAQPVERERLLASLLLALEDELNALEAEVQDPTRQSNLLDRFSRSSGWVFGKRVSVDEGGGYTGVTDGLDEAGFLRVRCDDTTIRTVLSGGVRPGPPARE